MDVAVVAGPHRPVVLQAYAGSRQPSIPRNGRIERTAGGGAARDVTRDIEDPTAGVDELTLIGRQPGDRRSDRLQLRAGSHHPIADGPITNLVLPGSRSGIQMSSGNGGGRWVRSAMTCPSDSAVTPLIKAWCVLV